VTVVVEFLGLHPYLLINRVSDNVGSVKHVLSALTKV
jgi:hypothetical protein